MEQTQDLLETFDLDSPLGLRIITQGLWVLVALVSLVTFQTHGPLAFHLAPAFSLNLALRPSSLKFYFSKSKSFNHFSSR